MPPPPEELAQPAEDLTEKDLSILDAISTGEEDELDTKVEQLETEMNSVMWQFKNPPSIERQDIARNKLLEIRGKFVGLGSSARGTSVADNILTLIESIDRVLETHTQ